MRNSESISRSVKINSSSEMRFKLISLDNVASLVTSWWNSIIATFSLMLLVFWNRIFRIHCGLQALTFCISLQDWQFAICPLVLMVTFFLHATQERDFVAVCTPMIFADILACDRDSMSVATAANVWVNAGISSNSKCSDLGVFRWGFLSGLKQTALTTVSLVWILQLKYFVCELAAFFTGDTEWIYPETVL